MNEPPVVEAYQLSSILNVFEPPVLTWRLATYGWPATAANRGVVTGSVAPDPPNPVVRSIPVKPVWRAYPVGVEVQSVALPVMLFFRDGFGCRFRRSPTGQLRPVSPLIGGF